MFVLPEQQSQRRATAQSKAKERDRRKPREASLVLELHWASTSYPRADQEAVRQTMDNEADKRKRKKEAESESMAADGTTQRRRGSQVHVQYGDRQRWW